MRTPSLHPRQLTSVCLLGMLISFVCIPTAVAQNATFHQIKAVELANIEAGAATQRQIDNLDDQRADLTHQYRSALSQLTQLKKYNDSQRKILQSQADEETSLKEQINSVANLERNIVPLMSDMLEALDNFVALDQPFLLDKRQQRLANLRSLLTDAKTSNAEKYRRILEAYQIENDFGRTIETWQGNLTPNDVNSPLVNFLKIGRVAYLYQTIDGKSAYRWDSKSWQPLNSSANEQVTQGIKMAKEQIPSNLLLIPVTAPAAIASN